MKFLSHWQSICYNFKPISRLSLINWLFNIKRRRYQWRNSCSLRSLQFLQERATVLLLEKRLSPKWQTATLKSNSSKNRRWCWNSPLPSLIYSQATVPIAHIVRIAPTARTVHTVLIALIIPAIKDWLFAERHFKTLCLSVFLYL